jgi:hypothetical protein
MAQSDQRGPRRGLGEQVRSVSIPRSLTTTPRSTGPLREREKHGDSAREPRLTIARCVQYFDGAVTFEEISYRTGLPKRELDYMTKEWKDDVSGDTVSIAHQPS